MVCARTGPPLPLQFHPSSRAEVPGRKGNSGVAGMGLVSGIRVAMAVTAVGTAVFVAPAVIQTASAQATRPTAPATQPGSELVSLNLPENAPLKVLLDYVSQEFGLNI